MANSHNLRCKTRTRLALAGLIACLSSAAFGQSAVTQNGTIVQQHLPLWRQDRQIGDVGGLTGQTSGPFVGRGAAPFSITDDRGCGLQFNDAATTGSYNYFCFGHNTSGAAIVNINGTSSPIPGSVAGIPFAIDNTALGAISTATTSMVIRRDYAANVGAPATLYKSSSGACANPDGGAQIASLDGNCWVASFDANPDIRVWGARASDGSVDAGPNIRAACRYSEEAGRTLSVPVGNFYFNTLDATGEGALVIGKVSKSGVLTPCNLEGQAVYTSPDACFTHGSTFILGANMNRPLLRVKGNAWNPYAAKMCFSGNKGQQTGWAGGPGGKLYTIMAEDWVSIAPASSYNLYESVIRDGYNGNFYYGAFRGLLYTINSWSIYSGQNDTDEAVRLLSADAIMYNFQQGFSTGYGIVVASGSNYSFVSGGAFFNQKGMYVGGSAVAYLSVVGMLFQHNLCEGLFIGADAAPAGKVPVGHSFVGLIFDENSAAADGVCSDVFIQSASVFRDTFTATVFGGNQFTGQNKPKYNIEMAGGGRIIANGSLANPLSSNTLGFTNDYVAVVGDYLVTPSWTPVFKGASTAGTPTGTNVGTWYRNGKEVTYNFTISLSALSGATGDAVIGPMLHQSKTGPQTACALSYKTGWTAPATFTEVNATVASNTNLISFVKSGSGVASAAAAVTEFGTGAIVIVGTCTFPVADNT